MQFRSVHASIVRYGKLPTCLHSRAIAFILLLYILWPMHKFIMGTVTNNLSTSDNVIVFCNFVDR